MNSGLFESLTGCFADGTPVDSVPENYRQIKSIMDHLCRLFSSRSGSIPHLPDYGLPDFSEVYRMTSEGTQRLQNALKLTVEKYEPRLKNIQVELVENKDKSSRICFILSGEVAKGTTIKLQTTLSNNQLPEITTYKKQE